MVTSFYLQLGFEDIPTSGKAVVPLLRLNSIPRRDDNSNVLVYWAFLVRESKPAISALLVGLGFEEQKGASITIVDLQDGSRIPSVTADLYSFPNDGLFKSVKLTEYLNIDLSQLPDSLPVSDDIILKSPSSLRVKIPSINIGNLKPNALTKFFGLSFFQVEFRFAQDSLPTELDPGFNFELGINVEFLKKLGLDGNTKPRITFNTTNLFQINGKDLIFSDSEPRIDIGNGLSLFFCGGNFRFEWELPTVTEGFPFDFFASNTHSIKIPRVALLAGFDSVDGLGIYLKNPLDKINIDSALAWIMATPSDTDLAFVLPTLKGNENPIPAFNFSLPFNLNGFDRFSPILKFDGLFKLKLPIELASLDEFNPIDFPTIQLPGFKASLGELLNNLSPVEFFFNKWRGNFKLENGKLKLNIRLPLQISSGAGVSLKITLSLKFDFDLETNLIRLVENTVYFYLGEVDGAQIQYLDFDGIFTLALPGNAPDSLARKESHDGYWDLAKHRVVLQYERPKNEQQPSPVYNAYIPGGKPNGSVENWVEKRFIFKLTNNFNADEWPTIPTSEDRKEYLRLGAEGISFKAEILKSKVAIGDVTALAPDKERNGIASEIVVINNTIRQACAFATMTLPGFNNVSVLADVALRKEPGKPARIVAGLQLQAANRETMGELDIGSLQMQLDRVHLVLDWIGDQNKWNLEAKADGSITFLPGILPNGFSPIEGERAIQVNNLDLLNLKNSNNIQLNLKKSLEIDLLEGLFTCRIDGLKLSEKNGKVQLFCQQVSFRFNRPGTLEVFVILGDPLGDGLTITLDPSSDVKKVDIAFPNTVRVEAKIGQSATFSGAISWGEEKGRRVFAAGGTVVIEGFPPVSATLKIGTGIKNGGQVVPNVAIFAAVGGLDTQLFSGVVLKELGGGIGINNRLAGLDPQPTPESILAKIDRLDPRDVTNWKFVPEDGFYLSIVAQTILASNPGGNTTTNAYVAWLILSLDSNLTIAAAGKLWLASSVEFVKKDVNFNRPLAIGAITLSPRRLTLRAAFRTLPSPAVETNPQLSSILNSARVRMSFFLSPDLVEYYLEELSFTAPFLDPDARMAVSGSYRIAVFDGTALLKARLNISGAYRKQLKGGPGGFEFSGALAVTIEYGGLLRRDGLVAYGMISADLSFFVSAFIEISFSVTISFVGWKKKFGYSQTFTLSPRSLRLGLRGRGAFDTGGAFGFDGGVSISVTIFSYPLKISPSLAVKKEVIDRVQREVAVFERRLDQFKNARIFLAPRERSLSVKIGSNEEWLLYESSRKGGKKYCLLVPKPGTAWLTPRFIEPDGDAGEIRFVEHVKKIEITIIRKNTGESETRTSLVPWDATNWKNLTEQPSGDEEIPSLEQLHLMFVESAKGKKDGQTDPPDLAPIQYKPENVISDRRVESASREYWTSEDRALLPDDVLPYDFRPLEELIASGESDKDLDSALKYERYRRQIIREELHDGEDLEDETEIEQKRSSLLQIMLEDLQNPVEPKVFTERGRVQNNIPLEYIFSIEENEEIEKIRIFREGETTGAEVKLIKPDRDEEVNPIGRIRSLPIRQKFIPRSESSEAKVVVKLPMKFDPKLLTKNLESINHFQIYRQLPGEGQPKKVADYIQPEIIFLKKEEEGKLFVNPYLYVEEFAVANNRFVEDNLQIERPEVLYFWRLVKHGETPSEEVRLDELQPFPPVRLYIPPSVTFPRDIDMLFAVEGLILDRKENAGRFLLIDRSGKQPDSAQLSDGRPLSIKDFQLWAQEEPLEQSGFYIGSEYGRDGRSGSDDEIDINPRRLAADRAYQSVEGKFQVTVREGETGGFRLNNLQAFHYGYSYQFFIRPAGSAPDALLAPLPLLVAQKFPKVKELGAIKPRQVERVEWIKDKEYTSTIRAKQNFLNTGDWAVVPAPVKAYSGGDLDINYLRFMWNTGNPRDGGVEILIRDRDEPTRQYRQLCEVAKQEVFQNTQRDFRIADFWTLTPWGIPDNISLENVCAAATDRDLTFETLLLPADLNIIFENYRLQTNLPVIKDLDEKTQDLKKALPTSPSYIWIKALTASIEWTVAINQFLRSPANVYGDRLDHQIEMRYLAIQSLIVGLKLPQDSSNLEILKKQFSDLKAWMEEFDKVTPESLIPIDDAGIDENKINAKLQDYQIAKRLVAIVRRRLVCANEIFTYHPDDLGEKQPQFYNIPSFLVEGEFFPRQEQFEKLIDKSNDLPEDKTISDFTKKLLEFFLTKPDDWLKKITDDVNNLYNEIIDPRSEEDKKLSAQKLPKAIGLIKVIENLRTVKPDGMIEVEPESPISIVERPHHQLPRNEEPPIEIGKLLPERLKASERSEFKTLSQFSSDVIFYFNLLERFGFTVDLEAVDKENNTLVSWSSLLDRLSLLKFPEKHQIIVVAALEPDSAYEREKSLGFPFIKLAVIPDSFWDDSKYLADHPMVSSSLKDWYGIRGIKHDNLDQSDRGYLTFMGQITRLLEKFPSSSTIGDKKYPFRVLLVEPANRRWLTVPAVGERARSISAVPDRKGHRFQVALRRVSRYEPLIQWAESKIIQTDLDSVGKAWNSVSVSRITKDLVEDETAKAGLTRDITVYPHPSLIRFSYQLPPEASRSLFNQISAIRTGYKGCDLNFEHRIADPFTGDKTLQKIFNQFRSDARVETEFAGRQEPSMKMNENSEIYLFRNERLIALPDLPFFYEYRLNVQTLFQTREPIPLPDRKDPKDQFKGRRLPSHIGYRKQTLTATEDHDTIRVKWIVALSLNIDHLTDKQIQSSPPLLFQNWDNYNNGSGTITEGVKLAADRIPDLQMSYSLCYRSGDEPEKPYVNVVRLYLPWANGYENPSGEGSGRPFARAYNNVKFSGQSNTPTIYPQILYKPASIDAEGKIRDAHFIVILNFEIEKESFLCDLASNSSRVVYQFFRDTLSVNSRALSGGD
jgi:hypothetical protein